MVDRNIFFMQPVSTRSGDGAHRPGATQSPWRLWTVWAEPGAQRECPSRVHKSIDTMFFM